MIFYGIITYVAILAVVWAFSTVCAEAGAVGLVGFIIWIFICCWITTALHDDGRNKK